MSLDFMTGTGKDLGFSDLFQDLAMNVLSACELYKYQK